jgi:3-methyladenine DNA glycosylase AlkD
MTTAAVVRAQLRSLGNPKDAAFARRYFKTGKGEYGEGDIFLGIRAAVIHAVVKEHRALPLPPVRALLRSATHEDRLVALLILVDQFRRGDDVARARIANLYLDHTRWINNWDLVDASAHHIIGPWAERTDRRLLDRLAASESLWEKRIAIIATLHFTRAGRFDETLRIARALLDDHEDLIHKAVGWMLREVGKRDVGTLRGFLDRNAAAMPRTALRYAIERLDPDERRRYLAAGRARTTATRRARATATKRAPPSAQRKRRHGGPVAGPSAEPAGERAGR